MKLAVNLLGLPTLRQGGAGMLSGLEVAGLRREGIDVDLKVVSNPEVAGELDLPSGISLVADGPAVSKVGNAISQLRSPFGYQKGRLAPADLADRDVIHYPFGFVAAPETDAAVVVTAVDLQHLHYPRFFSRKDRLIRAMRWHRSIRGATRVAVYSEAVKASVVERLGVDEDRIDVVGACIDQRFYEPEPAAGASGAGSPVPEGRYLLYPASPLPNKNHANLLRALAIARSTDPDLKLILVGPLTHDWTPVEAVVAELGLGDAVEIRGHVSLGDLVALYRGALALIFPSLFEGFGMPVLEAMAVGCPVIAADVPSVIEICGEEALVVEPEQPESIAAGITKMAASTEAEKADLIDRARARAELFRPEVMVDALLDSFSRAIGTIGSR